MAYTKTQCGGLLINTDSFKMINGIITDANATTVTNSFNATFCGGQYFDSSYFAQVNKVITTTGTTSVSTSSQANCSLLYDSSKFQLDSDGAIEYKSAVLTMNVTPTDATVVITDSNDNVIQASGDNTYPVQVTKGYTYVVSKAGYVTETDSVVINDDLEVTISLEEHMTTLTITTTPSDATINVVDSNETEITPTTTGVYPVQVTKEYTYTVSKTGYTTQTATVTISDALAVEITLVESA